VVGLGLAAHRNTASYKVILQLMNAVYEPGDNDPVETREWLESIDSVLRAAGPERAHFLIDRMVEHARRSGAYLPYSANTAYVNTIPVGKQPSYPGDRELERRIEAWIRWNAMAMVVQANRKSTEYGGHIASYASSATLYEVGFNHFWRAPTDTHPGDLVFMQGHSAPGIYARASSRGGSPNRSCSTSARKSTAGA
jgi:pyruvate dehydrogenase E1 component